MGWGSATPIFDLHMAVLIENLPPEEVLKAGRDMFNLLRDGDWDTYEESIYWRPYGVEYLHDEGYLDDDEYYEILEDT